MKSFKELGLDEQILKAIEELKFETPMPVQKEVIPHLLGETKKDIIALAQTGTGKTAAFGLPIIQKTDVNKNFIQFLILSPTRELCLQISDDLESYAKYKNGIKIAAVFGGASIERQIFKIQKGAQIISATPGRLLDLINRNVVDLSKIDTLVLDEADEMLNMGFREDIEEILRTVPKKRNTLLFSATMPKEIVAIANSYMHDPVEVTVGKKNSGAENVDHLCYLVSAKDRYLALKRIVDFHPEVYGIVFCRTRAETQDVADKLIKDGYNADSLHGDLSQNQRDAVMKKFRIRHVQLLVATDVAARGLDVDDLTHIINYNLPEENEIYTHRSGRTGRAGRKGTSIVIANIKEKNKLYDVEKKLGKQFKFAEIPTGKEICERQLFFLIDRMEKVEVDYSQIDPLLPEINKKLEWLDRDELIKKFVSVEFNRFLEYYKKMPDLAAPSSARGKEKSRSSNSNFTRFFINIGFRDGIKPNILMGLVNDFTGVRDIEIGKIEILKNFSFFEVDSNFAESVLSSFKDQEYKKRELNIEVAGSQGNEGKKSDRDSRGFSSRRRDDKEGFRGGDRDRKRFGSGDRRGKDDSRGSGSEGRERKRFGSDERRSDRVAPRSDGERRERKKFGSDREAPRGDGERRERKKFGRDETKEPKDIKRSGEKGKDKKQEWEKFAVEWNKKEHGLGEKKESGSKEKKKRDPNRPWANKEKKKFR